VTAADPDRIADYLFSARNLAEYRAFFALTDADVSRRILDCPGGAASVVAQLSAAGAEAVAVDPLYAASVGEVEALARRDAERANAHSLAGQDRYDWGFYGGARGHGAVRIDAAATFIEHRRSAPDRYVEAALPDLPFPDGAFDLALSSHLLFCYADRLDTAFHVDSLRELSRVADEVRVFPLIDYTGARQDALVDEVIERLAEHGLAARRVPVEFRFMRGADEMLLVERAVPR
jgi:SAM-dependent methyltransferase